MVQTFGINEEERNFVHSISNHTLSCYEMDRLFPNRNFYAVVGDFIWSDGTTWNYTSWSDGQPGSSQPQYFGEKCIWHGTNEKWGKGRCNKEMYSVCKKEIHSGLFPVTLYLEI